MPRVEIRPSLFFTFLIKQQDGMPMAVLCVEDLDHLVLTVADIKATCRFYQRHDAVHVRQRAHRPFVRQP